MNIRVNAETVDIKGPWYQSVARQVWMDTAVVVAAIALVMEFRGTH
jgi:hypothetical protein